MRIMSWYRRAKLGITSFHNLTNSTSQLHGKIPTFSFPRFKTNSTTPTPTPQQQTTNIRITSSHNLTNSTTKLYGKTISPTCKPPTSKIAVGFWIVGVAYGIVVVASGIGTLYYMFCYHGMRIVNVPFTNRKCLIMPTVMQKRLGDFMLEGYKIEYEGKLLDEKDPHSVRAKLILKNIIQGLERQVKCNPNSNVSGYYYDGFNWNILVVDDFIIEAHCIPGGTIFISVGMLRAFTDGEVAAVISHEVGHIVARHNVEVPHPNLNRCKRELEADYIGLLLMASAGYNPRIAVELLKKINLSTPDCSKGCRHEHQLVEERANSLAQAHVMEQALTIYKEDIFKVKDEVYKLWLKVYKWGCDTSYGWEMKCLKYSAFCLPGGQILKFTGLLQTHTGFNASPFPIMWVSCCYIINKSLCSKKLEHTRWHVQLHTHMKQKEGGPIGLIKSGDVITIDVQNRRMDVQLTEEEITKHREKWTPPRCKADRGVLYKVCKQFIPLMHMLYVDSNVQRTCKRLQGVV